MDMLRKLREAKGFTQKKVSGDLELSQQTYANYESGRRDPDYETVKKIAKYFNVSLDTLLENDNQEYDGMQNYDYSLTLKYYLQLYELDYVEFSHSIYRAVSVIDDYIKDNEDENTYEFKLYEWLNNWSYPNFLEKQVVLTMIDYLNMQLEINSEIKVITDELNINAKLIINKLEIQKLYELFDTTKEKYDALLLLEFEIAKKLAKTLSLDAVKWYLRDNIETTCFSEDSVINTINDEMLSFFKEQKMALDQTRYENNIKLSKSLGFAASESFGLLENENNIYFTILEDLGIKKIGNIRIAKLDRATLKNVYSIFIHELSSNHFLLSYLKNYGIDNEIKKIIENSKKNNEL